MAQKRNSPSISITLPHRTHVEIAALIDRGVCLSRSAVLALAVRKLAAEHRIEVSENKA